MNLVLHLLIKNFGKVKSADIALNDMVVFVGDNNSGKTMIMQLIYGIRKELRNFPVPVSGAEISDFNGQYLIRCARNWFEEVEHYVNQYLEDNKLRIITDIFGRPIPVGEIKILLEYDTSLFYVCSVSELPNRGTEDQKTEIGIDIRQYENGENIKSCKSEIDSWSNLDDVVNETLMIIWRIILSGKNSVDSDQLFLPASRSGLQLLCFTGTILPEK
ncbi:MAG: AAA family ATPase [Lachnospiraceae bacterium]